MRNTKLHNVRMNRVYKWYLRMHNCKFRFVSKLIEIFVRVIFSCDIPYQVIIGKNCKFAHNALGVVIHPEVVIGDNCVIGQNVTIGGRAGKSIVPKIGNDVLIGANALILGPVNIGSGAKIGAGAIVVKDIPQNAVVIPEASKVIIK